MGAGGLETTDIPDITHQSVILYLHSGFALESKLQSPRAGFSGQWLNCVFAGQVHYQAQDSQGLPGHLFHKGISSAQERRFLTLHNPAINWPSGH